MSGYSQMREEERDLFAAEYALGLLDGEDRSEAEALARSDPDFRGRAGAWASRLEPLLDEVEAAAPRPELWARIERALPAHASGGGGMQADNVVQLRRKVAVWRTWSAATTALAASLALFLAVRPESAPPPPPAAPAARPAPMVAMLESRTDPARLVATYDPAEGSLVVAPAVLTGAAGHEHELWLIMPGEDPKPAGIVRPGKPMRMKVPEPMMRRMGPDVTIAVSVEPVGGSPTGLPTGPVIASGKFSAT
jgi:anti-sigma-K factor RskA